MKNCKWKKLTENKENNFFVFKKTCKTRHYLDVYKQDYAYKKDKDWIVDLDTPSIGRTLRITKNKREAFKFARNYMKKH